LIDVFKLFRWIFLVLALTTLFATAGGSFYLYRFYQKIVADLPDPATVDDYRPDAVTKVFSDSGELIAEFYEQKRYPVKISDIPQTVRQAFLAAEDADFYRHPGVDIFSVIRAVLKNFQAGGAKQGASTITQQVVKNLLLTPERKLERKVKESLLAYRLEKRLTKDDIFEIYLNEIFLGNGAYGVVAAAKNYFHKQLDQLTLAEAALLAGLPKAPSAYSPVTNFPAAKNRQGYVLRQMQRAGFITGEELEKALVESVTVYPADDNNIYAAPYGVLQAKHELKQLFPDLDIERSGLRVYTTINKDLTEAASRALSTGLQATRERINQTSFKQVAGKKLKAANKLEGAVVLLDPHLGL
jgi:penicillin-binding protein 1A